MPHRDPPIDRAVPKPILHRAFLLHGAVGSGMGPDWGGRAGVLVLSLYGGAGCFAKLAQGLWSPRPSVRPLTLGLSPQSAKPASFATWRRTSTAPCVMSKCTKPDPSSASGELRGLPARRAPAQHRAPAPCRCSPCLLWGAALGTPGWGAGLCSQRRLVVVPPSRDHRISCSMKHLCSSPRTPQQWGFGVLSGWKGNGGGRKRHR